jgi:hypothetical protein
MMLVIDDVGNEKQNRSRQRRELTTLMRQHASPPNEKVPGRQQDETRGVQGGVEMREDGVEVDDSKQ